MIGPAPLPPVPAAHAPFPWLVTLAPLALSLAMALALRAPIALLMGVLGPALVASSWWQSARARRKAEALAEENYQESLRNFDLELSELAEGERRRASLALPSLEEQLADPLFRRTPGTLVRVGRGVWRPPPTHPLAALGSIGSMPAAIDAAEGVALVGGDDAAAGVWRMLFAQWVLASGAGGIDPPVPAAGETLPRDIRGLSRAVWVEGASGVPEECRVVLVVDSASRARVITAGEPPRLIHPDNLSHPQLARILEPVRQETAGAGSEPLLPARQRLLAKLAPEGPTIDLVREGPHAAIWGATGSGKSVAACALVSSLAGQYPPRDVAFVLVDFKGGAGLRPLATLPHTVGVVTDLEPGRSERARVGLEAEMLHRERIMADHGVQDSRDLPPEVLCPRLVVVIDEVAWLCEVSPAWASTITDIARRGRSLGVHLVLATQRISGALARGVMANVSLRICGRVSDDTELTEWMPGLNPAQKTAMTYLDPGRVLLQGAHLPPHWHQVAAHWPEIPEWEESSEWMVWSEELPGLVPPMPGIWGVRDDAIGRTHAQITENPLDSGSVIVIGEGGSGKTNAICALAGLSSRVIAPGRDIAVVWLALASATPSEVVVVDDADSLLHRAGADAEAFLLDAMEGCRGNLLLSASPRHRVTRQLARLTPHRLVLAVGADDASIWEAPAQSLPGRGRFGRSDIQVVFPCPELARWRPPLWEQGEYSPVVLCADSSAWSDYDTAWCVTAEDLPAEVGRLSMLLAQHPVIVDGLDHKEARAATLGRVQLPPLPAPLGAWWVWSRGSLQLASPAGLRPARR